MRIVRVIRNHSSSDPTVGCTGGQCPGFHLTDDGRVLVQGYSVNSSDKSAVELPFGEDVVAIPLETLHALSNALTR